MVWGGKVVYGERLGGWIVRLEVEEGVVGGEVKVL